MSAALKPCPFCGGEAEGFKDDPVPLRWLGVSCTKCGARTALSSHQERPVESWNQRAQPAEPAQGAAAPVSLLYCAACGWCRTSKEPNTTCDECGGVKWENADEYILNGRSAALSAAPTPAANEWSADRALGFEEGKAAGRRLAQWREPTPREAGSVPAAMQARIDDALFQALTARSHEGGYAVIREFWWRLDHATNTQSTASEASGEVAK